MRQPKIVIVSDLHLGTYGSHASDFIQYLESIEPEMLILNGDIVDMWQFKKKYFPHDHIQVLKTILDKALSGTQVYYLTGNHDDLLRKFSDISLGNIHLQDKMTFTTGGLNYWVFHGDVFDSSVNHSKWIATLGGKAYDLLIRMNRLINKGRLRFNKEPLSFSKKIKASVKKAVKYVDDFEKTAITLAIEKGYDYVICGHIHKASIKTYQNDKGSVTYMNSGDWVESLTALEYRDKEWHIFDYQANLKEQAKEKINQSKLQIA